TLGGASAPRHRLPRECPRVCSALDPTHAVSKGPLKQGFSRRCCDIAAICSIPESDSFQSSDYCLSRTLLTGVLEYCRMHSSKTSAPWPKPLKEKRCFVVERVVIQVLTLFHRFVPCPTKILPCGQNVDSWVSYIPLLCKVSCMRKGAALNLCCSAL